MTKSIILFVKKYKMDLKDFLPIVKLTNVLSSFEKEYLYSEVPLSKSYSRIPLFIAFSMHFNCNILPGPNLVKDGSGS